VLRQRGSWKNGNLGSGVSRQLFYSGLERLREKTDESREQSVDTTYDQDEGHDVGDHMLHDEGPVQTGTF